MAALTTADVPTYIAQRQAEVDLHDGKTEAGVSNASINRELAILKRAFTLAIKGGVLTARPHFRC